MCYVRNNLGIFVEENKKKGLRSEHLRINKKEKHTCCAWSDGLAKHRNNRVTCWSRPQGRQSRDERLQQRKFLLWDVDDVLTSVTSWVTLHAFENGEHGLVLGLSDVERGGIAAETKGFEKKDMEDTLSKR